jgi:hypothetical protein
MSTNGNVQQGAARFAKSTFSELGNCVEVAFFTGMVVRDAQRPHARPMYMTMETWAEHAPGLPADRYTANYFDGVLVRDSKDPDGPWLAYTNPEWDAFVNGVRHGEFDRS